MANIEPYPSILAAIGTASFFVAAGKWQGEKRYSG